MRPARHFRHEAGRASEDHPEVATPRPPRPNRASRLKRRIVGPPLATERLIHERLGKPTALAVFASDNLSSSAYATRRLRVLVVAGLGTAAFSRVVPITSRSSWCWASSCSRTGRRSARIRKRAAPIWSRATTSA